MQERQDLHRRRLLRVVPVLAEVLAAELLVLQQLELRVAPVVRVEQELEAMALKQLVAVVQPELVIQVVVLQEPLEPVLEPVQSELVLVQSELVMVQSELAMVQSELAPALSGLEPVRSALALQEWVPLEQAQVESVVMEPVEVAALPLAAAVRQAWQLVEE